MKKKILTLVSIIALALGLSALLIACDNGNDKKIEYSVTVVSPSEEPVPGVSVSWMSGSKKSGGAETDADGVATATLPSGTYTIALSGSALEGYEYDSMYVTASMPDAEIELSVKKVTYTVTVRDKDNKAAANVTVTWNGTNGTTGSGEGKTDAGGRAECELDYGTYTVSLDNNTLPDGNVGSGAQTVTGTSPSASFKLRAPAGEILTYKVIVRSEGSLLFKDTLVMVYDGRDVLTSGRTDDNGAFTFRAEEGDYNVTLSKTPAGYDCEPVTLTKTETEKELVLRSEIIGITPSSGTKYVMGDIFHDYTFTTPYKLAEYKYELDDEGNRVVAKDEDGNDVVLGEEIWSKSVSEILKTKKALIINNWGTNCSWCVTEMPDMDAVYKKYNDKIEMVAVSNYGGGDSDATIAKWYADYKYSFPMMRDTNDFTAKFGITGWPTTVVIDRYGAVARIEKGAITSIEAWERLINIYIDDDYKQTFTPGETVSDSIVYEVAKPDFKVDESHYENLGNAVLKNGYTLPADTPITWYGDENEDDYWPFLFGRFDNLESGNDYVLFASNGTSVPAEELYGKTEREGKANSMAILYADVTVKAGQALTFRYFTETEANADILYILWDGRIIREFSGDSKGWQTCYLYSEITDGTHKLSITYIKDTSENVGKDNVFIRGLELVDVLTITDSTDMLRGAGYGDIENGKFSYYATVAPGADGYYRVDATTLQNASYAGTDNNPLLLANLMNKTAWNNYYSIGDLVYLQYEDTGAYVVSCEFDLDGSGKKKDYRNEIIKYLKAAVASDVAYCVPVNETLQKLLAAFMKEYKRTERIWAGMDVSNEADYWHENEWLEICYFYSHYGSGSPVGNPVLGLMEETAIPLTALDVKYNAELTRNMYPFPSMVYSFTPQESAVYKIESFIPNGSKLSAQIWLYDDPDEFGNDRHLAYSGDFRVTRNAVNEQNFALCYYMQAGHTYYIRVALLMAASGEYEFNVTKIGQSYTELVPASADTYKGTLDENGNWSTDKIELEYAVDYELQSDGYYHVKNSSSQDDFIYLDVKYATTTALGTVPLERLCNYTDTDLLGKAFDYTMFDFRYYCRYHWEDDPDDSEGRKIATYYQESDAKVEVGNLKYYDDKIGALLPLSAEKSAKYKDYTDILKSYIDGAPKEGDKAGLIKVDQTLVDILTAYLELRLNSVYDDVVEFALENEWLRFCWRYETHDESHP